MMEAAGIGALDVILLAVGVLMLAVRPIRETPSPIKPGKGGAAE